MENIFYKLYDMSVTASICVLIICIIRQFLKKTPKIYSYLLWSIVAFRLICPFSLESDISLFNHLSFHAKQTEITGTFIDTKKTENDKFFENNTITSETVSAEEQTTVTTSMPRHIILSALPYVWMGGLVLLLLRSFRQYQRLTKKLHNTAYLNTSCHIGNKTIPVWESDSLSTAFILGVFRLKIFLPSHLGEEERTFCLAHESTHIRRKDYLVKQFAYLLSCIYWFNPVIRIAYFLMTKDMEMSCDEAVLGRGELTVRKDYSNTLLNLASRQYRFGGSPLAFGENNIRSRIKNIMNYKKPAFWVSALCLICVCFLMTAMVTNAKSVRRLSKKELAFYTEYLNLPENNGFIRDQYYDPKHIYWDIVLYDGANLQEKSFTEEKIQDDCVYSGKKTTSDVSSSIHLIPPEQIEKFAEEKTGIPYDVMKYKVSWKYLSEYGTYCYFYNPEETLSIEVECTGGYLDKETGLLILEYQSVHHDKLQGSVTLLLDSGNPENLYFIKNVIHNT